MHDGTGTHAADKLKRLDFHYAIASELYFLVFVSWNHIWTTFLTLSFISACEFSCNPPQASEALGMISPLKRRSYNCRASMNRMSTRALWAGDIHSLVEEYVVKVEVVMPQEGFENVKMLIEYVVQGAGDRNLPSARFCTARVSWFLKCWRRTTGHPQHGQRTTACR